MVETDVYKGYMCIMSKSALITARLDAETMDPVDRVSKARGRSRAWFAARAIESVARQEAEFLASIQEGIDSADRGDVVFHEQVALEMQEMIARHKGRCKEKRQD
jgi:predicted transcriptional regulator